MAAEKEILVMQLDALSEKLLRVLNRVAPPKLKPEFSLRIYGKFHRFIAPLKDQLKEIEEGAQEEDLSGNQLAALWARYVSLKRETQKLLAQGLDFLGGLAVRELDLEAGTWAVAEHLVYYYAQQMGINGTLEAIPGRDRLNSDLESYQLARIIHVPLPHWDIWYLPLMAHELGLLATLAEPFSLYWREQIEQVQRLLDDTPPSELPPLLPEIRDIWNARAHVVDLAAFREQTRPLLEPLIKGQRQYLAHLIADVFATYLVGPAYVYALLFLILDPTEPLVEGQEAAPAGSDRSPYLPADAQRMVIVMQTLETMNEQVKEDRYDTGPYVSELKLLTFTWQHALEISGNLAAYQRLQEMIQPWARNVYRLIDHNFGLVKETAALWEKAQQQLVPLLQNGTDTPYRLELPFDLLLLINAAWWCRPRFLDDIGRLSQACQQLLSGQQAVVGVNAKPAEIREEAYRLLYSRFYDLESELKRLWNLIQSPEINSADRITVVGRFNRLLSEQNYTLKKLAKLIGRQSSLSASLRQLYKQSQGGGMQTLRREALDFLGGALMRREGLDQGVCDMAEMLLHDYAGMTGVNWASRVIPGDNPLFSQAMDLVHLEFPGDIWSLPLMAHEFGHITALATPAFQDLLIEEVAAAARRHPEANSWDETQTRSYIEQCRSHLHEFFADAFAVYCQGPAFAKAAILLNFNPIESYVPRGGHPTYAERVEVILKVLAEMNEQEKWDIYDSGPYQDVMRWLADRWFLAVDAMGIPNDQEHQVQTLQAKNLAGKLFNLLERYYGFAKYQADQWRWAEGMAKKLLTGEADLAGRSWRDILNIAWACRIRHPDLYTNIEKLIQAEAQRGALARGEIA
jgi:hypothetical protein